MKKTRLLSILAITSLTVYFSAFISCHKEYSCEGCIVIEPISISDTTIARDTAKIDSTIKFPFCSTCDSNPADALNGWGFKNYNSVICGNVLYTALDSGHNVVIRGFQDCTKDTQFVITGRFPTQTFQANRLNVTASYSNFLLYAPNNVILAVSSGTNGTGTPLTMNVVLDTFNLSTGVATFRFYGYAYTNKGGSSYITGDRSYISSGRFKVKIK